MGGLRGRSGQVFGVAGLAEQPGATLGAMVKARCVVGFPCVVQVTSSCAIARPGLPPGKEIKLMEIHTLGERRESKVNRSASIISEDRPL